MRGSSIENRKVKIARAKESLHLRVAYTIPRPSTKAYMMPCSQPRPAMETSSDDGIFGVEMSFSAWLEIPHT
jgi:hypothetical protein